MNSRMWSRPVGAFLVWSGLLAIPAVLGCAGCSKEEARSAPPPAVDVATAEARDVPVEIHTIGTVNPIESVTIRAVVGGYLSRVGFEEGQEVEAGQVLFQIDPRAFDAQVAAGRANLDQTRGQLENAERQLERGQELFAKNFISSEDLDNLKTAAATLRAAAAAQSAALDRVRLDRQFTTIRAPFTGRIGARLASKGDLVVANTTSLATIKRIKPIDVQFAISERELPAARRAMAAGEVPVRAKPRKEQGEPGTGTLVFIDNEVDARTGSIVLKARFANADERLWPGEYVDVTVQLGIQAGAVVVPSSAIQTGQQGEYLYLIDAEGKAELRTVKTGPVRDGHTVIDEGVRAGETVVTDGQIRLTPGVKVEIRRRGEGAESPS